MRLNSELEALRTEFNGLQTRYTQMSQEKDHWLAELGSDEKAQEVYQEMVCVKEQAQELEQSAARLRLENTELFNKYNDLDHDFKLLQQENDKSKTDNDRLMEEVEELRDEVEVLDNQNHQMQQWLGKYKSTRTVLDGANHKNTVCFLIRTFTVWSLWRIGVYVLSTTAIGGSDQNGTEIWTETAARSRRVETEI